MNKRYIPLLIVMLFLVSFTGNVTGQRKQQVKTVKIESTLKDDAGNPVSNATIYGGEGAIEVKTDDNGRFSIEVPENSDVLIEAKGFNSLVVSSSLVSESITLVKTPPLMDEASIVNIPFDKIKKGEVVNSVYTLNPKEIVRYDNIQSIYDYLIGRVPGMMGSNNIRGIGAPVFIIDGVPRDPSSLNIEEVDQITILKDVNSAMLYGSQARNGVILITTKRGVANKRIRNVTVEQGISKPIALPKYLNSADYMTLFKEATENDGDVSGITNDDISNFASGKNPYRYPDVDYYSSEYLKSSRPTTRVLTEFGGGNNVTQYYANASWIHAGSLYALGEGSKASNDRFNIRANVNINITESIKAYVDAIGIFDIAKGPRGSFWNTAATLHPNRKPDLLPVDLIKANATMLGGADLETARLVDGKYILGGSNAYQDNVYGNMLFAGYDKSMDRTATFNNGVEFDLKNITEGLKLRTYISFDILNSYHTQINNLYAVYEALWETNPGGQDSIVSLTKIGKDENSGVQSLPVSLMYYERRFGVNASLDYSRTFNDDHTFSGTLLAYYDLLRVNTDDIWSWPGDNKHAHLGLRAAYNYQNKYFVEFNSAYINGFKLPEGNRGGFSPSIGLGWIVTEDMAENVNVNYLKLKASAGILNTEFEANNYRLAEQTFVIGSNFSWYEGLRSNSAILSQRAASPNLTFEKMKNVNLGVEGIFFNNALSVDANLFYTKNTGQLVQRRAYYPNLLYNNIPYENYNATSYSGAELGLIWSESLGDVSFQIGTNLLYATSKVVTRDEIWSNDYQYRQGLAADAIFALEAIGFFNSQSDIDNSPLQLFGEVKPGDIKYKDQDGNGVIDSDDVIKIGNSRPRLTYGIHFNVNYKNFTLFALGHGQTGADAFYSGDYFRVDGTDKYSEEVLGRWTEATKNTATYPRLSAKANNNNTQSSTFWLYKNNFFMLDRIQLTYNLPTNISNKLFSKDMFVYLRGDNLLRMSEDAEKRQLVIGGPPNYRNYALGVRVVF